MAIVDCRKNMFVSDLLILQQSRVHIDRAEHSSCPNSALVPENVKDLHKIVLED